MNRRHMLLAGLAAPLAAASESRGQNTIRSGASGPDTVETALSGRETLQGIAYDGERFYAGFSGPGQMDVYVPSNPPSDAYTRIGNTDLPANCNHPNDLEFRESSNTLFALGWGRPSEVKLYEFKVSSLLLSSGPAVSVNDWGPWDGDDEFIKNHCPCIVSCDGLDIWVGFRNNCEGDHSKGPKGCKLKLSRLLSKCELSEPIEFDVDDKFIQGGAIKSGHLFLLTGDTGMPETHSIQKFDLRGGACQNKWGLGWERDGRHEPEGLCVQGDNFYYGLADGIRTKVPPFRPHPNTVWRFRLGLKAMLAAASECA